MPRYWFRLDDVTPLAGHALGCTQHTTTRAEVLAGADNGPALVFTSTRDNATMSSNGNPAWHSHDGGEHVAYATAWRHTPTGRTSHVHLTDYSRALLPLTGQVRHQLDTAVNSGHSRISIHLDSRDQHLISPYAIRTTTGHDTGLPAGRQWRPAQVTCPDVGDAVYPAPVPDGYLTADGYHLSRFDRATIARIGADLDQLRDLDTTTPGWYPILRLHGDDLTVLHEQTHAGNWTCRQVDQIRPDHDGYFPLGTYQWAWEVVDQPSAWRVGAHRLRAWSRACASVPAALMRPDQHTPPAFAIRRKRTLPRERGVAPVTEHHDPPEYTGPDNTADADPGAAGQHQQPTPPGLPQLPPGARLLSADEAITLIVTGDHPQSGAGSLPLDAAFIDALRLGVLVACRLPDGRLAFTPAAPS